MPRKDVKDLTVFPPSTFHLSPRLAFTLAEVLIVVGIIGIVAEMTIPTLISQYEDQATVTALKKEASVIQQAMTMATAEEGQIEDWYTGNDAIAATTAVNAILSKYLKITKNCAADTGCLPSYKYLSKTHLGLPPDYENTTDGTYSKMQLADGSIIFFSALTTQVVWYGGWSSPSSTSIRAIKFFIDVNGQKGPNRFGYDLFSFGYFSPEVANKIKGGVGIFAGPYVIVPEGRLNTSLGSILNNKCNVQSTSGDGYGCSAWAYYMGNRDYLRCQGLGPTKTKCD